VVPNRDWLRVAQGGDERVIQPHKAATKGSSSLVVLNPSALSQFCRTARRKWQRTLRGGCRCWAPSPYKQIDNCSLPQHASKRGNWSLFHLSRDFAQGYSEMLIQFPGDGCSPPHIINYARATSRLPTSASYILHISTRKQRLCFTSQAFATI
jgi:hypothetical protein